MGKLAESLVGDRRTSGESGSPDNFNYTESDARCRPMGLGGCDDSARRQKRTRLSPTRSATRTSRSS